MSFFKVLYLTFFLIGSKIFAPVVDAETQTSNTEKCRGFGCQHQKRANEPWFRFGNFRRWRKTDVSSRPFLLPGERPQFHDGIDPHPHGPGLAHAPPPPRRGYGHPHPHGEGFHHRPPPTPGGPPPFHDGRGGPPRPGYGHSHPHGRGRGKPHPHGEGFHHRQPPPPGRPYDSPHR